METKAYPQLKAIIVGKGVLGSAKRMGNKVSGCVRKSMKRR